MPHRAAGGVPVRRVFARVPGGRERCGPAAEMESTVSWNDLSAAASKNPTDADAVGSPPAHGDADPRRQAVVNETEDVPAPFEARGRVDARFGNCPRLGTGVHLLAARGTT